MALSDSSFELILQDLLHQKDVMESLETENRELRQQIADLRAGRGIVVDILGSRFSLLGEQTDTTFYTASTAPSTPVPVPSERREEPNWVMAQEPVSPPEEAPVAEQAESIVPETPLPMMDFLLEDDEPITTSPFLDLQQTDELSFETTNKLAVWREPAPTPTPIPASTREGKQPVAINEDQKAALRRELIGSFLLE